LDSINEEDLYRKLAQLNITTIIVSHKLSTIKNSLSTLTYANNPSMTSRTKNLLCRKAQRGKHTDLAKNVSS